MYNMIVTVDCISHGQIRRYGDTEAIYEVSAEYWWDATSGLRKSDTFKLDSNRALGFALNKHGGLDWSDPDMRRIPMKYEQRMWYAEYIDYVRETDPGVWRVRLVTPYDD
jgi:hypothetical protein